MALRPTDLLGWIWRQFRRVGALVLIVLLLFGANLMWRLSIDRPEIFADPVAQFKYGSTGGDKNFGFPYPMWEAMPVLFKRFLPEGRQDEGWAALGFIYEDEKNLPREGLRQRRPVGTSLRNHMGIDRVFLNCAGCHAGSVRTEEGGKAVVYAGMPANTLDLSAFQEFLRRAATSQDFTPERFLAQIDAMNIRLGFINRLALRYYGVALARTQILLLADRFRFLDREPAFGPGRFDTFNPGKALLNWNFDDLPEAELIGVVDFPAVWQQKKKEGMHLHWDGNNTYVRERNRSAAFGTGATPATLDRPSIKRMEEWLETAEPPRFADLFPGQFNPDRAKVGADIFRDNCMGCHGKDGRDFSGGKVGEVLAIGAIGTDRSRFDNYTYELSLNQNVLYPNNDQERFQNFKKTEGYARVPLDGIWLRAPYLHNGSVPTLWALLQPPALRPKMFLRGYDVYDPVDMGFESRPGNIPEGKRSKLFCYVTHDGEGSKCPTGKAPQGAKYKCDGEGGVCKGNGNHGHAFGTSLTDDQKRALIEHLKTF
jgi:hypothetical protein